MLVTMPGLEACSLNFVPVTKRIIVHETKRTVIHGGAKIRAADGKITMGPIITTSGRLDLSDQTTTTKVATQAHVTMAEESIIERKVKMPWLRMLDKAAKGLIKDVKRVSETVVTCVGGEHGAKDCPNISRELRPRKAPSFAEDTVLVRWMPKKTKEDILYLQKIYMQCHCILLATTTKCIAG